MVGVMPELPDIVAYMDALMPRVLGCELSKVHVRSPFLVRSVEPPMSEVERRKVIALRRLGKRIVFCMSDDLYLVFHLMIAGRFRWSPCGAKPPGRIGLAAFDFPSGTLLLTEASKKKRASLHVVRGAADLASHERGGLEVLDANAAQYRDALRRENRTLKRALTDPRLFGGIGNAYSDEILHAAGLSPAKTTANLTDAEIGRLRDATRSTLEHWIAVLRAEFADRFPGPGDITAFRDGFAVHGRYGQACPNCGTICISYFT